LIEAPSQLHLALPQDDVPNMHVQNFPLYVVLHDRKRKHLKGIKEKFMIRLS